jgi:septin family protein
MNNKIEIIIKIIGHTGSGKSTLIKYVLEQKLLDCTIIKRYSTADSRPEDIDDPEVIRVNDSDFDKLKLEYTTKKELEIDKKIRIVRSGFKHIDIVNSLTKFPYILMICNYDLDEQMTKNFEQYKQIKLLVKSDPDKVLKREDLHPHRKANLNDQRNRKKQYQESDFNYVLYNLTTLNDFHTNVRNVFNSINALSNLNA